MEFRLGKVFDRESGEDIGGWDLFTVPEADVWAWVAEHAEDSAVGEKMRNALKEEYIVLFPEYLEINFPAGALPGEELAYCLSFAYEDVSIFNPQFVPADR